MGKSYKKNFNKEKGRVRPGKNETPQAMRKKLLGSSYTPDESWPKTQRIDSEEAYEED